MYVIYTYTYGRINCRYRKGYEKGITKSIISVQDESNKEAAQLLRENEKAMELERKESELRYQEGLLFVLYSVVSK